MELDIMYQVYQAGSSVLLGLAAGLYYDVLKAVRCTKKRTPWATMRFDLLFWLGLAIALFIQTMTMGGGTVRIFMLVMNALGALLYFLALSEMSLFLLNKILRFLQIATSPICKIWTKGKSVVKKGKGGFQNWVKHYIIGHIHLHNTKRSVQKREERGDEGAKKGKHIYQTGSAAVGYLRGVQLDRSPRADRGRARGRGRPGRSRG